MPCPFPGMDPYLEKYQYWADFTPRFMVAISNALNPRLLPRYEALIEEYVVVTHEEIRIHPQWTPGLATGMATVDTTMVELEYPDLEPMTQRVLKIIQRSNRQVVTVIEILSPSNKEPGENGIETYLGKRAEYLASGCHLVEIDLLRGGERLPMRQPLPIGDYYIYISRRSRRPRGQVIGWNWKSGLPKISIPCWMATPKLSRTFNPSFNPPMNRPAMTEFSPTMRRWNRL